MTCSTYVRAYHKRYATFYVAYCLCEGWNSRISASANEAEAQTAEHRQVPRETVDSRPLVLIQSTPKGNAEPETGPHGTPPDRMYPPALIHVTPSG